MTDTERAKDAIREAIAGKRKVIIHGYSSGIGRFYIGLADHIEIIQGVELKKYAQDYVKRINW